MSYSSLTQKGQVTIPTKIRKALKLRRGDRVKFTLDEKREQIMIAKDTQPVEDLFGMYSVNFPVSDADIKEGIKQGAARANRT